MTSAVACPLETARGTGPSPRVTSAHDTGPTSQANRAEFEHEHEHEHETDIVTPTAAQRQCLAGEVPQDA